MTHRSPPADPARAALAFTYRLEDEVSLDRFAQPNLERWEVSVYLRDAGAGRERSEIGCAQVLIVNLEAGRDVREFANRSSGSWLDLDGTSTVAPESRVLVLDRVWLRPEHRGDGLGPIIAAAVIARLGRDCHLAACYPAPFEEGDAGPDREASIEALGRIWAQVGFCHWSDGVWMLDLRRHDTRAVLAALVDARSG